MGMDKQNVAPGLSERIAREIMATPALKELILLQMKDIKAETAPGLVRTLLWGDPGISMSLFGALPDAINWMLELLLELGRQLNGLPEPLLKDILGQVGMGIDGERLKLLPEVYRQLVKRIVVGEGKTPEETRAAVIAALNTALASLERLTAKLDDNRADIARSLARDFKALDTAALGKSLRRAGMLAVAAARGPKEKSGSKAPKAALAAAGGIVALLALRLVVRKARGR
jgi:hypothetical protein